jgi:cob(I)alamin adenosyltransferase
MPARNKKMLELAGTGDDGSTGLLGGGRARKDDPRIEAYGTIDEASSAVGLAKALSPHARVRAICEELQRGLYALGAELATNPDSGTSFAHATEAGVDRLDALIAELERSVKMPRPRRVRWTSRAR